MFFRSNAIHHTGYQSVTCISSTLEDRVSVILLLPMVKVKKVKLSFEQAVEAPTFSRKSTQRW
jgi:hypothetical protein